MAIGIIEIQNLVNAYKVTDLVSKSIECRIIHQEKTFGGRLVTVVFESSVSDLQVAMDLVKKMYQGTTLLKVAEVVPNPPKELMHYLEKGKFHE